MTDKLTDSEITIKALKEVLEVMLSEGDLQRISTISHTIDLINRLQAEIERLKATVDSFADIGKLYSEIKAEAYKEFAELLHCQCENIINQPHNENVRPISWKVAYEEFDKKVDNLLKKIGG